MDIVQIVGGVAPPVDEQRVAWELEGFVTGHYPETAEHRGGMGEVAEPWRITSVGAADWAMQRLAEIHARAAEYDAEAERWATVARDIRKAGVFFRQHLEQWAISQRTEHVKSFPLAHGAVMTREQPAGVIVSDVDAAVAWCKAHAPKAVKVTEEVLLRELSLRITEVVTGWRFTDGVGEVWTIGDAELAGVLDDMDGYRPLVELVRGVLAEHASPLRLAADSIEAEYIRQQLTSWVMEPATIVDVSAVTVPGVVDEHGMVADGFGIRPAKVTPTVNVGA